MFMLSSVGFKEKRQTNIPEDHESTAQHVLSHHRPAWENQSAYMDDEQRHGERPANDDKTRGGSMQTMTLFTCLKTDATSEIHATDTTGANKNALGLLWVISTRLHKWHFTKTPGEITLWSPPWWKLLSLNFHTSVHPWLRLISFSHSEWFQTDLLSENLGKIVACLPSYRSLCWEKSAGWRSFCNNYNTSRCFSHY